MRKNFSRTFTALSLVLSLWVGTLAAVAPQTQTTVQTPAGSQKSGANSTASKDAKDADKSKQGNAHATATAQPASNKTLSTNEDPSLIGKRNINKGIISKMSSGVDKEVAQGRQIAAEVDRTAKFVDDPVITEYINRVGQNIVLHSDAKVPFTIKVIDSDEVNAFALPGGFFYVNKGLILAADNEAEVAGVMAHEIAHVAARHAMENQTKANIANGLLTVGSIFLGGLGGMAILNGAQFGALLGFMKFSRSAESEADMLGVEYLYAAGYDPSAMSTMFEKLASKNKKKPGTMSKLFASHPQSIDRMEASRALVARFPEREEYVVSTSEFNRVKNRLLRLSNSRVTTVGNIAAGDDSDSSPGRPTLKRRSPAPEDTSTTGSGDEQKQTEQNAPPTLKRRTPPADTTPPSDKP